MSRFYVSKYLDTFRIPLGGRGRAPLRGAPTPLGSKNQRKIRETGSSKYSFLRLPAKRSIAAL